jgi:hypothetical protein
MTSIAPAPWFPNVAALYMSTRGPYTRLVREWFDVQRNAKLYAGPLPVVAHPPCGPWSKLRALCTKQDPACGLRAVNQVRKWGGVLEHPEGSKLWIACDMPRPDELPDRYGGRTYAVSQVSWGHPCVKPTWLYCVRVPHDLVVDGLRTGGAPTHRVTSGPRGPKLPTAHKTMASATPFEFAVWLCSLANAVAR